MGKNKLRGVEMQFCQKYKKIEGKTKKEFEDLEPEFYKKFCLDFVNQCKDNLNFKKVSTEDGIVFLIDIPEKKRLVNRINEKVSRTKPLKLKGDLKIIEKKEGK